MLETLFKAAHGVVLIGWLALLMCPIRPTLLIGVARGVSVLLAAGYAVLLLAAPGGGPGLGSDYTLQGLAAFFADPHLRLVAWVHYLAFDLWVGAWQAQEARRIGMPHALLVPALALTFLLGPIGLLGFMALRAMRRRIAR